MNDCLLTISIPTYNRSHYLRFLIDSIDSDLIKNQDDVDVWICDNASTDDTCGILRYCDELGLSVNYHRHHYNIGGNLNIAYAAKIGRGKYVWVLGDDEILPIGALGKILDYLRTGLDFLILNHAVYDRSMSRVRINRWYRISTDCIINGKHNAMEKLGVGPTFISSVIAKKGMLDSLSEEEVSYYSSYGFNQLYAFYKSMDLVNAHGLITAENLVLARGDNSGEGYCWNHFFVTGLGVVFTDLRKNAGYSAKDIRAALGSVMVRYHIKRALNESAEGRSNRELRQLAFRYYSVHYLFWLVFLPVTFLPNWLMRLVKKLKKAILR